MNRFKKVPLIICCLGLFLVAFFTVYKMASLSAQSITVLTDVNGVVDQFQTEPLPPVRLLFLGDMMFDRGVRVQIKKYGSDAVYASTTRALSMDADLTIANLEGPITTYTSKTIDKNGKGIPGFTFTFPTSTAPEIKASGIDIVSLANNHTENFGADGLKQTVKWLSSAGLHFFGNPTNTNISTPNPSMPLEKIVCIEEKSWCMAIIGYHEFTTIDGSVITQKIRELNGARTEKSIDAIVVMPHWGVEYQSIPTSKQISLAHTWIDAGADFIIGAHPHIIQSMELYKSKPIFYSLGNYLFDQYFSYDTTHGLAIKIVPETKEINLIPIDNTGIFVKSANELDRTKILQSLAKASRAFTSTSTRDEILTGTVHY